MSDTKKNGNTAKDGKSGADEMPTVNWIDTNMQTAYANVVNASGTKEEITLLFGTNQTWKMPESHEISVNLNERIILNPYAAKRLWVLLGGVLSQYEKKYGPLDLKAGMKAGDKPGTEP